MSLGAFAASRPFTLGVELELQIVNRHDYDLAPGSADLLSWMGRRQLACDVKPEITSSMIETSTGVCATHAEVLAQLREVRTALVDAAGRLNLRLCGGGTHAFQDWSKRRIFDTPRYRQVSELYGYLSKQFTVFGQHVHIGCPGPDEALWLLHALARFVPHAIALSASSPFVQGSDTGFQSARLNSVFAFPLSGRAPFALRWSEFATYFEKMHRTGVVESMKDFYWDIRPKPEDDYLVYTYNRFQACRFGLEGVVVDPRTAQHQGLRTLILETIRQVAPHAAALGAQAGLDLLHAALDDPLGSDAAWLRAIQAEERYLPEVVRRQCLRFEGA